jgi:acyl carrier protein
MHDITMRFEQCLRRHLRLVKPDSIDYAVALAQLGLDSMTAVALLLDIEKTFDIRFPDDMIAEDTFRTAGGLKKAVQQLLERKTS